MKDKYFSSSSFYLCCYLLSKGMELSSIEQLQGSRRCNFIFKDIPQRENWVKNFNYAQPQSQEVLVDAREFAVAIKTLKERMYQVC